MKRQSMLWVVLLLIVMLLPWVRSDGANAQTNVSSNVSSWTRPFLGRWDLTIRTPNRELPSWIEVSEERGQPRILMVGISDHATPLRKFRIKRGQIEFLSPKREEGFSDDMMFKGRLLGDELVGTVTKPDGVSWRWTGRRAPSLRRKGIPKWGKPIALFDGKNFAGWKFSDPNRANIWTVEGGNLVENGRGSELITTSKFEDFKLHLEFECGPRSNSGVYLRGRYEVQIETNSAAEPPSHHTGGIYGFLAPQVEMPRRAGVWQSFDITLVGRTITVLQDGRMIIDHREIPGITGGALDSHEGLPGPIYLQGSEEGRVAFRNIVIVPAQ